MENWLLVVKLDINIWLSSMNKLEILLLALYVAFMFCCYFISSLAERSSTMIYSELRKDNCKFITILWYYFYRWMKLILDMCAKESKLRANIMWNLLISLFWPSEPSMLLIVIKEKTQQIKSGHKGAHFQE